jgi:hypothetical protein
MWKTEIIIQVNDIVGSPGWLPSKVVLQNNIYKVHRKERDNGRSKTEKGRGGREKEKEKGIQNIYLLKYRTIGHADSS